MKVDCPRSVEVGVGAGDLVMVSVMVELNGDEGADETVSVELLVAGGASCRLVVVRDDEELEELLELPALIV